MKPGIKTIVVGVSLFILGAVVIPMAIVLSFIIGDSNEKRFKVPGNTQLVIEKPGRYYLWNDYQTVFDGKSYNRSEIIPDGIEIKIMNAETGELFDFVSDSSISSSSGSSSKNSIGYIEIQSPCTVEIEIAGNEEKRVFSFAESNLLKMLGPIFGGFVLSMVFALAGLGIIAWGIVKLVRFKKGHGNG